MMKTCRKVLRCARKYYKNGCPNFYELASAASLHPGDVISACEMLVEKGFMKYLYPVLTEKTSPIPCGVQLTLKGKMSAEYTANRFRRYMTKNWIAILALIVSIIALLQSIGAISLPIKATDNQCNNGSEQANLGD